MGWGIGVGGLRSGGLESGGWSQGLGSGELELGSRSGGGWSWGGGVGELGSGVCSWFEITLKVDLQVPCGFLCCFQLPCSWFNSAL